MLVCERGRGRGRGGGRGERKSKTRSLSSLQLQSPSFSWDQITSYEADLEESAFTFLYTRGEGKDPRWVKVYSPFVSHVVEWVWWSGRGL